MKSVGIVLTFVVVVFGDQCHEQIGLLDAKLSKVLNILESHFKTNHQGSTVGKPSYKPNGVYSGTGYAPGGVAPSGSQYLGNTYGGAIGLSGTIGNSVTGYEGLRSSNELKKADSHIAVSTEKRESGYADEIGYRGVDKLGDAQLAKKGFEKGEGYLAAANDGSVYNADYSGTRINDSVSATRRNIVKEQQETQESYFKDYDTQNHEGDYTGSEFDIGYKAQDVKGGFSQKEKEKELKQANYNDFASEGSQHAGGKYYGEDLQKYNEASDEEKYREFGVGAPNNGYYDDSSMYDKFQGDTGDVYGDGYGDGYGTSGLATNRIQSSKEKDAHIKGYGSEFDGTDSYGKSQKNEGNSGYKKDYTEADAFNVGNYQDVSAKGHNKNANYKGNYKTNKEKKDSGYKFRNDIDIDEIGTPSRYNSLVVNDNTYTFSGSENKKTDNSEYKKGQYKDAELVKKYSAADQKKDYKAKDYDNQHSEDANTRVYTGIDKQRQQDAHGLKREFGSQKDDYRPVRESARNQGIYGGYGYGNRYRRRRN